MTTSFRRFPGHCRSRLSLPLLIPPPSRVALPPLVPSAYAAGRSYDNGDKLLQDWGGGGDDGGGGSDDEGGGDGRGGRGGSGGNGEGPGGDDDDGNSRDRPHPFLSLLALAMPAALIALIAWKIWSRSREGENKGRGAGRGTGGGGGGGGKGASFASMASVLSPPSSAPPRPPPPTPPFSAADNADVQALRRLVREAFETLQAHGERLEALEPESEGGGVGGAPSPSPPPPPSSSSSPFSPSRPSRGARLLRDAEAASRFAPLGAMRRRAGGSSARRAAAAGAAESASLEGEVVVDAGVANSNSSSHPSSSSLLPATRARVRACLHGPARGGRDAWLAQVDAFGGGSSPPSSPSSGQSPAAALSRLLYSLSLGRRSRLLLSPLGCRGCDVAPTLNPTAGAGLTSAARDGSSPHLRLGGGGEEAGFGGSGSGSGNQAAIGWRHRWRGGAGVSAAAFHRPPPFPPSPPPSLSPQKSVSPGGGKTSTLIQLDGPLTDSLSAGVVAVLERPHGGRGRREGRDARGGGGRAPSPSDTWERAHSGPSPTSSSFGSEGEEEEDLIYGGGISRSGRDSASASAATLGAMAAAALGESGDITASAWACARVERAAAKPSQNLSRATNDASSSSSSSSLPSASRGWGASLASRPSSGGYHKRQPGWILAVAGETPPAEKRRKGKRSSITAEASLVLPLDSNERNGGGSATLVPGVVFARRGGENSVSLACRSVLAF